ncbi:MAG: xanthine dehydrogenase accessory protein XdhC [Rhizobiaceae bacterium]|nr:xanthine dehydrogenase accessory protein XdhC [Rhizobiaceae bacterium]
MAHDVKKLEEFLHGAHDVALVQVEVAKGSTPRETGAWMLVANQKIFGTIGGGQLEYMAIDKARALLSRAEVGREFMSVPLGPEIGQCCGGHVKLVLQRIDEPLKQAILAKANAEQEALPSVYVFGAGHVGHALAAALSLLPVQVTVVETRAGELDGLPENVDARLTALPEEAVREAPAGAAFIVLTHDHALDFIIVAEALKRNDAAYVGMIGSKTKKATFRNWFLKVAGGSMDAFDRLVLPIGGDTVKDKRPAVIAALTAAEVMTAISRTASSQKSRTALSQ